MRGNVEALLKITQNIYNCTWFSESFLLFQPAIEKNIP